MQLQLLGLRGEMRAMREGFGKFLNPRRTVCCEMFLLIYREQGNGVEGLLGMHWCNGEASF